MKIAVGTTSEQKIGYLKEVLGEIGIEAELILFNADSKVSSQPISEDETSTGSINRARAAFENNKDADFGMGIEVGYHLNKKGNYEAFCCTTIVDGNSFLETCKSSSYILPEFHQKILKSGGYLGEYVREYKKDIDKPVANYIREMVRGRKPLIVESIRNVLLNYLENKE